MRLPERPNNAVEQVVVRVSYPTAHPLDSHLWQLSRSLADVGLVFLLGTVLLALIASGSSVGRTVARWIPEPVRSFLQSEEMKPADWGTTRTPKLALAAGEATASPRAVHRSHSRPAASFGIGSTEEEIRAIQGAPTAVTDNVWKYGKSEVYFLNGRVVSWVNDPANPLHVR